MTKKTNLKPVAAVVGAALVGSLAAVGVANAADNPFGASQLDGGYMQLASSHQGGAPSRSPAAGSWNGSTAGAGRKRSTAAQATRASRVTALSASPAVSAAVRT